MSVGDFKTFIEVALETIEEEKYSASEERFEHLRVRLEELIKRSRELEV